MLQAIVACGVRLLAVISHRDEDGEYVMKEVPQIFAENGDGDRWVYTYAVPGNPERFAGKVQRAGQIDIRFWTETHPAYGTSAWIGNVRMDAEREREDAERDHWDGWSPERSHY